MGALESFANLLGLPVRQADDALRSEPAAKAVLARRDFFAAAGAMAAAAAIYSIPTQKPEALIQLPKASPFRFNLATGCVSIYHFTSTGGVFTPGYTRQEDVAKMLTHLGRKA